MRQVIATNDAPKAIGPYSQAIKANGLIFVSGQIAFDPATQQIIEGDVAAQTERVRRLVERAGLPSHIAAVAPAAAFEHMRIDKKVLGGRLRLVLLRGIGDAFVTADYPPEALTRTLAAHLGGSG